MWPEWIFSCSEMSILIHLLLIVYAQVCTILLGPEFEIQNGLHINEELPSSCVWKCMRKHPRQVKPIWARLTWEWLQCVSIPCTLLNCLEGSTTDSSVLQTSQRLARRGESLPQLHLLTHFSLIFSPSKNSSGAWCSCIIFHFLCVFHISSSFRLHSQIVQSQAYIPLCM